MRRREMLIATAAMGLLPLSVPRAGIDHVPYTPAAYKAAMESGKALLVDFYAPW